MRLIVAAALLAFVPFAANAAEQVRVIDISKENAARSAAIIASAKSPFIGTSPQIVSTTARNSRAQASEADVRASRSVPRTTTRTTAGSSDSALVRIITPGNDAVADRTYLVPRE
ncbi:hypothetical protein [Rhodoplanes sp. Z2-YC6860]|uniref:hypothetical protein n=1 Tax=Rhodoplanes sp. Z2-YC6860 TaxID=674703 RepID=UPI0012ED71CE|nr:hypothetical protein [Rhodoplanes sp. Z2-YC6860]